MTHHPKLAPLMQRAVAKIGGWNIADERSVVADEDPDIAERERP
jgi:hypothetical protein